MTEADRSGVVGLPLFDMLAPHALAVRYAKVTHRDAVAFYKSNHYAKGVSLSATSFGCYEGDTLTGCVSFGTPCSENVRASVLGAEHKDSVKELQRLARAPSCTIYPSTLVATAIRMYCAHRAAKRYAPLRVLISFADEHEGHHGGVYQAMSWLYCGTSEAWVDTYRDAQGTLRHRRQNGVNITKAHAQQLGWTHERHFHVKHRYIKLLGNKSERKRSRKLLRYEVLPYKKPQESNT